MDTTNQHRAWMKRSRARFYAGGVSQKVFDRWLREGLPHVRKIVGTRKGQNGENEPVYRIFVHPDDIDSWMRKDLVTDTPEEKTVNALLEGLQ